MATDQPHVTIQIANISEMWRWRSISCRVDASAAVSVIAADVLESLGVPGMGLAPTAAARSPDGRRTGVVAAHFRGCIAPVEVVSGAPGEENLLGAAAVAALHIGAGAVPAGAIGEAASAAGRALETR